MKIKNIYRMLSFAIIGSAMVLMSVSTVYGLSIDDYIADIRDEYRNNDNYWDVVEDAVKNFDEKTLVKQREQFEKRYNSLSKHLTELEKKPQENEQYIKHTKEDLQRFDKYINLLKSEQNMRKEALESNTEDGDGGEPEKFEDLPIDDAPVNQNVNASEMQPTSVANSATSPTATPEVNANITQTVTTNDNGTITQETSSNAIKGGQGGLTLTSDDEKADDAATGEPQAEEAAKEDDQKAEDDKKAEDAKKEEKFTGVYKERQLIPDAMAAHCQINAEDIVKDMSRLEGCIRKYVTEMNNDNAAEAAEGKKTFGVLRYNALNDAFKKAIAKAAAVNGYETAMNNYAEASANAKTKFDSEANISNTLAFSTDVQNSIRDIYIENLRLEAINGFGDVDPSALGEEEKSEKAKNVEEFSQNSDAATVKVETQVEIGGAGEEENVGADENIADSDTTDGGAVGGDDGAQSSKQEPEQTAPKSAYEQKLANMSDKELAEEASRLKGLQEEYAEYLAHQNDGEGWKVDDEELAEWKNAGKMLEQVINEQMRRRR